MKRSEMESILMNSIIRNTYNYGEEHDEKAILKDLEQAGMLPPPSSWFEDYDSYRDLSWESEDEM